MRALALAAALGGAWLLPVGPPGIAVPIVAALVLGAAWTARRPSASALALGLLALALSAQAALLDAAWIVWIDLLAAWVLGALAAGGTTFAALWAPLSRLTLAPELLPRPNASALPAMRGAVLGTVVLVPFAALFLTADAAFAELARAIPDPGVDLMPARALTFTLVLAAALGLALAARDPVHARPFRFTRRLSVAEWAIPLALLDLLFLAFVTVQLTVLFGGHDRVLRTSGLTYAEYARSGFWQLLCAAGLTFGVIAAAMLLTAPQSRRELWLRRALLGSLCALTLVILVSALHRLRLYEAAYGLTRDRLAAEALTVWLGLLFLVALAAALEPVRRRAAPLAVAGSGLLLLAGSLADPEQTIAERNIERYHATGSLDSVYLRSLSTDALPALSTLPRHLQERTTAAILAGRDTEPWSSWNLSRSRAKERGTAVAGREAQFSRGPAFRNVPWSGVHERKTAGRVSGCARTSSSTTLSASRGDTEEDELPVKEASSEETPYGRYVTSEGWFVLNLADALAVRNEEKGGAMYPLEPRESPFAEFGARVRVVWPGDPNALYHAEGAQEGFLVLSGECTLIVEEEERPLRQWDYFHCPADTRHVIVGAGDVPCAILMIGARPEVERLSYPVSEVAAKYGASAGKETDDPDEAYADWPGEYVPVRLEWPLDSDAKP